MKNYRILFLKKALLGQKTNLNNCDEVLDKCIKLAIKDMLTAGRYYYKFIPDMESLLISYKHILETNHYIFNEELLLKTSYLFGNKEHIYNGQNFVTRFGLSQKLVNMSFKYFYVFYEELNKKYNINFKKCDCPLDSIVLGQLNNDAIWSKLNIENYINIQNIIAHKLSTQKLTDELRGIHNLAYDFLFW